nr:hypothetical protein [Tanacetum cinerariifolium]
MARLAFCDYHNMIAIMEKYEHNTDFQRIVDFVEASHLRIETTDEGTKILAVVDGTPTEPHHTPSPKAQQTSHIATSSPSLPPVTTELLPTVIPTDTPQQDEMASKITAQDLEISQLKARVKLLEDREGEGNAQSGEDAPIKEMSLDEGEEAAIERSTEKGSNDTEEMVNVLTSLDAATVLSSGVSVSISPVTEVYVVEVLTGSGSIPT